MYLLAKEVWRSGDSRNRKKKAYTNCVGVCVGVCVVVHVVCTGCLCVWFVYK